MYKFYQSYLKLVEEDYNSRKEKDGKYTDFELLMKEIPFKNYVLEKLGKSFDTVKLFSKCILSSMIRPQRLILSDENYYIACDMITNTYYICYKELMMIDIDYPSIKNTDETDKTDKTDKIDKTDIIKNFKSDDKCWMLYETRNGIHAFLVSEKCEYKTKESVELMMGLNCDFYYVIYCYLRGYSVRLNKKNGEPEVKYNFMGFFGNKRLVKRELFDLTNLHIDLLHKFKNVGFSMMNAK